MTHTRNIVAAAVLAITVTACSSSSAGVHHPDWNGWARYEQETSSALTSDQIIALGKSHHLATCDLAGSKLIYGTQQTERIEGTWFFLCGESYARKAIDGSFASESLKAAGRAEIGRLEAIYGKH